MKKIRTITDFKNQLANDPQLQNDFKDDPVKAASQLSDSIPDTQVYRMIVFFLGAAVIGDLVALAVLFGVKGYVDPTVLTILSSVASGCIGALAGLLPGSNASSN